MKPLTKIRILSIILTLVFTPLIIINTNLRKQGFDELWFAVWGFASCYLFIVMIIAMESMESHKFTALKISVTILYCLGSGWFSLWMCGWYLGY